MAKRFTDSDKWGDPWFFNLPPMLKLFWLYVLDTCDCAGIWKDKFAQFSQSTQFEITPDLFEKHFSDRIFQISKETFIVPKFIKFQYPNFNPEKNNAHKGVVKSLTYHRVSLGVLEGLVYKELESHSDTVQKEGYRSFTGLGIGIGLGLGLGSGIGTEPLKISSEEFFKGIDLDS